MGYTLVAEIWAWNLHPNKLHWLRKWSYGKPILRENLLSRQLKWGYFDAITEFFDNKVFSDVAVDDE